MKLSVAINIFNRPELGYAIRQKATERIALTYRGSIWLGGGTLNCRKDQLARGKKTNPTKYYSQPSWWLK